MPGEEAMESLRQEEMATMVMEDSEEAAFRAAMEDGPSISAVDQGVLKNLNDMAQELKRLALDAELKEQSAKEANEKYYKYRTQILPTAMFSAGLRDLTLMDGSKISVDTKVYCSPNKNEKDKAIMAEWLRQKGGEHLLKTFAVVDGKFADQLANIPHEDKADMNTNSLKAWLKSQLGLSGGMPQFNVEDIPECMHFVQVDEVGITMP